MKKILTLILAGLMLNQPVMAKLDEDYYKAAVALRDYTSRRRVEAYNQTQATIGRINFIRAKLNEINNITNDIRASVERFRRECDPKTMKFSDQLYRCRDLVTLLYLDASHFNGSYSNFSKSANYKVMTETPDVRDLNFAVDVADAINLSGQLKDQYHENLREIYQKIAEYEVQSSIKKIEAETQADRTRIMCRIRPHTVLQRFNNAQIERRKGLDTNDVYLLTSADQTSLSQLMELEVLSKKCPAQPQLAEIKTRISAFLKARLSPEQNIVVAQKACAGLNPKKATKSVLQICREQKFNPATFFTLHLELVRSNKEGV